MNDANVSANLTMPDCVTYLTQVFCRSHVASSCIVNYQEIHVMLATITGQ